MRAEERMRAPGGMEAGKGDMGRTSGSRRTDNIAGTPSSDPQPGVVEDACRTKCGG
jgi:hypothetical protein